MRSATTAHNRVRSAARHVVDTIVMVSIVASFAALVTAHVALCAGLVTRDPWWRGAIAIAVPPLAPFWGFREKLRARAILWLVAALVYVAARIAARAITR